MTTLKIDVEALRRIDVRSIVERDLGQGRRSGDRVMYRCPFHNDSTPSLAVRSQDWRCFGCGKHGNGIEWIMRFHGLKFVEACERLAGGSLPLAPVATYNAAKPTQASPPDAAWQRKALDIVHEAERNLHHEVMGQRAMQYLKETRGLKYEEICRARMGYIPGAPSEWRQIYGLNVPCGIVIPWCIEGELWAVKVRRAAGRIKYQQVAGSSSGGLYGIDCVTGNQLVIICEGEFDALTARQTGLVEAVALGSASNQLRVRWMERLLLAPRLAARLDHDEAGKQALARLRAVSRRITSADVPQPYKDMNDYWLGEPAQFVDWLRAL
jgi:DNA primase